MIVKSAIHILGTGDRLSRLRLIAEEGKQLTNNGEEMWSCVDVDSTAGWYEVDIPEIEAE